MGVENLSEITYAPHFTLHRTVQNNDSALPATKRGGLNLADFDEVVVIASFHNSATAADVTPYFWSDAKGAFVTDNTPVTVTFSGDGLYKYAVNRHGSVFFRVESIVGGAVDTDRVKMEIAGLPMYHEIG